MADAPLLYRFMKQVVPPLVELYLPVEIEGIDNVPDRGGAVLACNHLSFIDSVLLPLRLDRPVYFLGKAEYFASWRTRWFFSRMGVVPVHREGGRKGRESVREGVRILEEGDLLGIYPEGTRSPDGRLYRGKTGPVRIALRAGVPIVPCAVTGTDRIMPTGAWLPRRGPATVRYGPPLDPSGYGSAERNPAALRRATDELMHEIMLLSGQEYVDRYATEIKRRNRGGVVRRRRGDVTRRRRGDVTRRHRGGVTRRRRGDVTRRRTGPPS